MHEPTTDELKAAFLDTGLTFLGYTFERAMAVRMIRTAIACKVKAAHRAARNNGTPAPIQPGLI